jgi:diguanylate cyclase (GGDEF)-like protein/PAS domain S-box-containing protein
MASIQSVFVRFKTSVKIQIAVFVSVLFFIAALLLAKHFADELEDDFRSLLHHQQFAATSDIAESIGNGVAIRSDSLSLIADAIKPEWVAQPQRLNEFLQAQHSIYRLLPAGLFVISTDGTILADYPEIPGRKGRNVAQRDYFIEAVKNGSLAIGKPFAAPSTVRPVVTWGLPIKDKNDRVVAVLGASALIQKSDLFAEIVPRDSRSLGDIHVISLKDGIVVASTDSRLTLASTENAEVKALYGKFKSGWDGSDLLVDGNGMKSLVSGKRVPQTSWLVISALPESIAFAPISDNVRDAYRDAAIMAILVAFLSWLFLRWQLDPLAKSAQTINEIASGQAPLRPLPEIGGKEIRQLLIGFNRLQERIDQQENQLRTSEERWKFAVEGSRDGVWDRDMVTGKVTYSKRYKEMYGFGEDELMDENESWHARMHPEDVAEIEAHRKSYLAGESETYVNERRMQCKDGSWKWVLARGMVIRSAEDGKPLRTIGTHTDISEQKRMEVELRDLATSDPLTGLPNRRHFLSRLEEEFVRLQRLEKQSVCVLMLDLDHFKQVNDTYGHSTGDAVLKHFAKILHEGLRKIDTAGRLGGEEFGIILPGADVAAAETFAERLRHMVETSPLQTDGLAVKSTVSIGVAAMRPIYTSSNDVLEHADEALYAAKSGGRNCVRVFIE